MDVSITCNGQHRDSQPGCGSRLNVQHPTLQLIYTMVKGDSVRQWITYVCPNCKAVGVIPCFDSKFEFLKNLAIHYPDITPPKLSTNEAA